MSEPKQQLYKDGNKWCKGCSDYIELSKFYHIYSNIHSTLCKTHNNKLRNENKLLSLLNHPKPKKEKTTGFKKLPENIRNSIIADLKNKHSLMRISKDYNLKYPTLIKWNSEKQLV